jgi:exonuclease SbcC
MKLLSARIRGATGIWMGLRVDEINIDFRKTGAGLLGFVGPFGSGKSTVLANLHPYRSVPGHKGGFARQYRLKDSCRDLLYKIGDDEYRFLIEINATAARPFVKSTVYKNGEPLNLDGGEKSYNEQVEKLFGSEPLYFASAFMAQSPVSFSSMIPSERSAAILQLFNCEHYQVKCEAAKLAGINVKSQIDRIEMVIGQLTDTITGWELIATKITEAQLEATYQNDIVESVAIGIKNAEAEYERLQGLYTAQQVTRSQLATAKLRLNDLTSEYKKTSANYDYKLGLLRQQIDSDQSTVDRIDAEYTPEGLESINDDINAADEAKAAYEATGEDQGKYNSLSKNLDEQRSAFILTKQRYDAASAATRSAIDRGKRDAAILETVPCQVLPESWDDQTGTGLSGDNVREQCQSCQFIKNAVKAKGDIQTLETQQVDCNRIWERTATDLETSIALIKKTIDALGFDPDMAAHLKAEHQRYEKLNPVALKHQYDIAIEKRNSLTQRVNENRTALGNLQAEAETVISNLSLEIGSISSLITNIEAEIDATLEDQVRDAGIAVDGARYEQTHFTEKLATTKATLATLQENKEKADVANTQLQAEKIKLAVLQSHLADWDHLAASLSRNGGFQSMLIESLGVQMMPFCDELLAMYGRPWTMEILTSMESVTTKGKMDDGFWVFVNRPEGRTELKDLSGGEGKIVDEILQSAAMLLVRQRSGLLLETVVRDEADGSLDPEGALQYFNNVQAAHNVSKVYQTLIVTHRQELIDMIPQRIRFVPGVGVKVEIE